MPDLRIAILLLATLATAADAAIYKCVDGTGRVTFTDAPCRGGKRVDIPGGGTSSGTSASSGSSAPAPRARIPTPVDFPRIDSAAQKRRDDIRVQVLRDEITSERQSAATAKQQFVTGQKLLPGERATDPTYRERVARLREAITRHEQNVAAIERELSKLR